MEPTFRSGDFIVAHRFHPGGPLAIGDIVTFREGRVLVTHRIVNLTGAPGARQLQTKGDANPDPDPQPVPEAFVEATYAFRVPAYGYVTGFVQQPLGRLLVIVLPSVAVIMLEARKLVAALRKPKAAAPQAPAAPAAMATPRPPARFEVIRRP